MRTQSFARRRFAATRRGGLSLMLCLGLGLGTIACGDDDDSASNDGSSGKNGGSSGKDGGSSGSGGDTSTGTSGSGGDTSTGSSGSGGGGKVTPDQAAAGACGMGMSGGDTMCTGIDEYTDCAINECDFDECVGADGPCADYLDCFEKADDPCKVDCTQSDECKACFTSKNQCTTDKCISKLQCGNREEGGACDMLEDCCKDMMDSPACAMVNVIVVGGDETCQSIVDLACGNGAGTAGMGGNAGDGAAGSTGGSDKTCDDLKACCDGLDNEQYKMICMQAYDAAKSSSDPDMVCAMVYPGLTGIGCR